MFRGSGGVSVGLLDILRPFLPQVKSAFKEYGVEDIKYGFEGNRLVVKFVISENKRHKVEEELPKALGLADENRALMKMVGIEDFKVKSVEDGLALIIDCASDDVRVTLCDLFDELREFVV